jgi:phosphatidylserine/phosphatidylglycerophosphate/cardiolipin synthase-like enzyme
MPLRSHAELWRTIEEKAQMAREKLAAVAYVTSDDKVCFDKGDTLITDASDESIAGGQTNVEVLARAKGRGADLYSLPGLHAKVMVLGEWAVIGSANLSRRSESLIEAAWVINDHGHVSEVKKWINNLKKQATRIDDIFLQHIRAIPVNRGTSDEPTARVEQHEISLTDRGWILRASGRNEGSGTEAAPW